MENACPETNDSQMSFLRKCF